MTTKPVKETTVTNKILKKLNEIEGCYARKVHGGRYGSGWPDVIACLNGRLLALEVKSPAAKRGVTPLQEAELAKWTKAGAIAGVVRSWEEVESLLVKHGAIPCG